MEYNVAMINYIHKSRKPKAHNKKHRRKPK
jgi:hypothetical protein